MKRLFKTIIHYLKRIIILIIKIIMLIIPKNKKLILFSAWFGQKYADSSMYMYEYMLDNKEYKVYWYTLNKDVYYSLLKNNKPVIYGKSIRGIIYQIRAKVLVSSVQLADFNHYFLSKCIYLDLDHGFPIKDSGYEMNTATKRLISYNRFLQLFVRYYMSASSLFVKEIIKRCYLIRDDQILKCNKPRIDTFYDEELRKGKNKIVDEIKKGKKAIVYMPTHRSCGNVLIDINKLFDLEKLNEFCEKNNLVFIIKKHFYHRNEKVNLSSYSSIFDITNEDIETQTLLYQADLLISDYSACYIDYLLLDRPIILYAYDLESFLKDERKLYLSFDENKSGFYVKNFIQLLSHLDYVISNNWDDNLASERKRIRDLYFLEELQLGHIRYDISLLIKDLISNNYYSNWEEKK